MATKRQGAILLKPALWGLLAVGLLVSRPASAKDLCITFGSADIVGTTASIPAKAKCAPFTGFVASFPGALLNGTLCTSSDGTTVIVYLMTGIGGPESLVAELAASTLSSTNGEDCPAYAGSCFTGISVSVVKCSKPLPPIPAITGEHPPLGSYITAP